MKFKDLILAIPNYFYIDHINFTLIILICGYPGVGKTTLANELAPFD